MVMFKLVLRGPPGVVQNGEGNRPNFALQGRVQGLGYENADPAHGQVKSPALQRRAAVKQVLGPQDDGKVVGQALAAIQTAVVRGHGRSSGDGCARMRQA